MCGRFVRASPSRSLEEAFALDSAPELPPQYNIAPTDPVAIVRPSEEKGRELAIVRWGLIPFWAKDAKIGSRMINARAESLESSPAFRKALERRCLVPADGFYEWKKLGKKKQPYYVHAPGPLAFAGLWAKWKAPSGDTIESCTIITVEASESMRALHDRMPLIVDRDRYGLWLDRGAPITLALSALMGRPLDASLEMHAVTPEVGRVGFQDPRAIEPLSA